MTARSNWLLLATILLASPTFGAPTPEPPPPPAPGVLRRRSGAVRECDDTLSEQRAISGVRHLTQSNGTTGAGQAVALTSDTGYFWFFSSNNVEMVIKVVDGRALNSRFWVFAGGLTNVQAVITVTDTQTGVVRTYTNPQSTAFQLIQDTNAFADGAANGTDGENVACAARRCAAPV